MGNPKHKPPVATPDVSGRFYEENGPDHAGACVTPPDFNLDASYSEPDHSGPDYHGAPACVDGVSDPILDAINLAFANEKGSWAKGRLRELESILPAVRNILEGAAVSNPAEGSLHHHSAYAGWDMKSGLKKGLVSLYKAIHEGKTEKEKASHLRNAKKSLGSTFSQVNRFAKDKKFRDKPGYKELKAAMDAGITTKISGMESALKISKPKKANKKGGGGSGSSKGFNRQKVTDFTQLPGLAAPTAAAPVEGSMAAGVEAAMQRDMVVNSGSVEDFLYVNIPDIVSGTGKSKKAMSMWKKIRRYRNKHLTAVYGAHVKNPTDPVAKKAYEDALAKMEAEIGPEIRATAKSLWTADIGAVKTYKGEGESLHSDLKGQREALAETAGGEGFDPASVDKEGLKTNATAIRKRIYSFRLQSDKLGLPKDASKFIKNTGWTAYKALGSVISTLKKKATKSRVDSVIANLQKAEGKMKEIEDKLKAIVEDVEKQNKAVKHITDHLSDPSKVPLVKPVKRHGVSVTFKGFGEGQDVTGSYGTKPESMIGIYEDVWSPRSITDAQGTFSRPKGAERGKKVYEELKANHGFTESEAKILGSVSTGEGDYHSVNSVDVMRISLGFIQFAGASFTGLLEDVKNEDAAFFKKHFEQYGILLNDGKTKMPPITPRKDRHIPGAEHGKPKEERNKTNNKLVVYDHTARQWVNGAEALAVLQSDPRYLLLIQSSVKDPAMQFAQIKRAKNKYHNATRKGRISYKSVGLEPPAGNKKAKFQVRDVFKNELCAYGVTAWGIAAGPGRGIGLAKKVIKAIVAEKGVKTLEELQKISQSEMTAIFKKHYTKWGRPTKFGKAIGKPLSDSTYDGVY